MVAWSWTEFAVNGIKDSPKKESEILIKMFHTIMSYDSLLLIKRKWMQYIVFLKLSRPSMLIKVSGTCISIYPIKKILKEKYVISNINI